MTGYPTSYTCLFNSRAGEGLTLDRVEIPLIQRDYAQGRLGAAVAEIRRDFVEVLLTAVAGGDPVGLDFVYGKVEAGTLRPLDGQQRLTTLFLLHWYFASLAGELEPGAPWTQFSYATRFSARRFCERLAQNPLPADDRRPSEWIVDQAWYLHVWRDDPTVMAMLVMIDAIDSEAARLFPDLDPRSAWGRLTDPDSPAIWFHVLELHDMGSDEDLYIKMNSRGKPLTPFENFKARFEQDIEYSGRAGELAHKIDGSWSDLLWPMHGGDFIVDDEFMRYLDYITEICEFRQGTTSRSGRLGPRARAVFGEGNDRAEAHLDFLFAAFDKWTSAHHIAATFADTFATALPGDPDYDPTKVTVFGASDTNLFEACVHRFRSDSDSVLAFPRPQGLLLYAVLLHVIHATGDFARRIRVLRNLVAASEDEIRRSAMPTLLADVEHVIVDGDLEAVAGFSVNQVADERLKRRFLDENPHLAHVLFRLEDHPILRGTLSAFDLDPATFASRAGAFESAFAERQTWTELTGALLAVGEYQRKPHRLSAWQFGTGSANHESVWRSLLTNAPRGVLNQTRRVLGTFLDGLARSNLGPLEHFEQVMAAWLTDRESAGILDWRYYLVKYPSMREGDSGIYYGVSGNLGYMLCMLRKSQRNSWYRDPILLEVWRSSGVHKRATDPWFTGYETSERWLTLVRSGAALRCVEDGYEVSPPEDHSMLSAFDRVCEQHAVTPLPHCGLLRVAQADRGQGLVDTTNRVVLGAELLRALVDAGL